MKTILKLVVVPLFFIYFFTSCKILRTSLMFKTPRNYKFEAFNDTMTGQNYKISRNDLLQIALYSNDGFKQVNLTLDNNTQNENGIIEILVELDDSIKLPLFGRIRATGKTTRQLEEELELMYNEYYINTFVGVRVTNKRVLVFSGTGATGKVVPLANNNITVIEALALAGGITEDGKSYRVKLIRDSKTNPKVYLIDLSTIKGLKEGSTIVAANDIIYVEPRVRFARRLATEITPFLHHTFYYINFNKLV